MISDTLADAAHEIRDHYLKEEVFRKRYKGIETQIEIVLYYMDALRLYLDASPDDEVLLAEMLAHIAQAAPSTDALARRARILGTVADLRRRKGLEVGEDPTNYWLLEQAACLKGKE